MTDPVPVSVMVFTLNEEVNLPRCLDSLAGYSDVTVVDSFSSDRTEAICRKYGVHFCQHHFSGFGSQRNWAIEHVDTVYPWIMILDADERVTGDLTEELVEIVKSRPTDIGAYRVRRRFHLWGRWLRYSSLYPNWVVRFIHKERVRYIDRGHAETQEVKGEIGSLRNDLLDENRKGIDFWFERQNRYSRQDAEYEHGLRTTAIDWKSLMSRDVLKRRAALKSLASRVPMRGTLYFFYSYVLRGGFRDGWDGLAFCRMKAMHQNMVEIKKYDMRRQQCGS